MVTRHKYSEEELQWLRDHIKETTYSDLSRDFGDKFGVFISANSLKGYCHKHGLTNGNNSKYQKNNVPYNKGKKMNFNSPEAEARSKATRFKKGRKNPKAKPLGSEMMVRGYRSVKVQNDHPIPIYNWKEKHRILYEEVYGEVPENHVLVFINGNKEDIRIENLMAVHKRAIPVFFNLYGYSGDSDLDQAHWMMARLIADANYAARTKLDIPLAISLSNLS